MRWALALLAVTGCTKLFNIQQVDQGTGDGGSEPQTDAMVDAPKVNTCLSDDFNSGTFNTAVYTFVQPTGGSTAANNGGIIISWPANTPGDNYGSVFTVSTFDLRGGDATVELDTFSGDMDDAELDVVLDDAHHYLIAVNPSNLEFDLYDGDARNYTQVGMTTYSGFPLTLQISHDLGTNMVTYTATSSTGSKYTISIPLAFTVQAVHVGFDGGTYGAATMVGNAKFDNLVVRSPFCL